MTKDEETKAPSLRAWLRALAVYAAAWAVWVGLYVVAAACSLNDRIRKKDRHPLAGASGLEALALGLALFGKKEEPGNKNRCGACRRFTVVTPLDSKYPMGLCSEFWKYCSSSSPPTMRDCFEPPPTKTDKELGGAGDAK